MFSEGLHRGSSCSERSGTPLWTAHAKLWMARAELWMARAELWTARAELCCWPPSWPKLSQFNWLPSPSVRASNSSCIGGSRW